MIKSDCDTTSSTVFDVDSSQSNNGGIAASAEFPGFTNVHEGHGEAIPKDDDPQAAALNRRSFLTLSAALGLAGLAGCRRPDLEILPYSAIPDAQVGHIAPGKPTFYATCLPRPGGAFPILVECHDGRPTKIEGNPRHPASRGSTDAYAQAAVMDLYSPNRVMSEKYPGVMEKHAPQALGRVRPLRGRWPKHSPRTAEKGSPFSPTRFRRRRCD